MHYTDDGDCLAPAKQIVGRRSSFSGTAATYANVTTVFFGGDRIIATSPDFAGNETGVFNFFKFLNRSLT